MSKAIVEPTGDKICPECGKPFFVQYSDLWTYKRREGPRLKFFCSYTCVRAYDKKKGEKPVARRVISKEQEKEAVMIALDGGDPLTFLEKCGIQNPSQKWYDIKEATKDSDPEIYAQLPNRIQRKAKQPTLADAMTGMQNAADQFFGKCKDMGLKVETPEQPKISQPVNYDGMTVREIEGLFGRYRRTDVSAKIYIDFEFTDETDVVSFTVDQWRAFRKEQEKSFAILGVAL